MAAFSAQISAMSIAFFLLSIIRITFEELQLSFDPEISMTTPEIIARWGYKVETHRVVTDDGYILEMHRVPHGMADNGQLDERQVVFMQHGLLSSSSNWVTNLPNESAAFVFADAGFDVWLGNFRGNTYSRGHISLSTRDAQYWNFSWDEMANYDLPAMIDYTLEKSNKSRLYYIGHSEGTTVAFAAFSTQKKLSQKGVLKNA